MRSFNVLSSQNPLIKEQRAHEVAIGTKAARAGKIEIETETDTDTESEYFSCIELCL